MGKKFRVFGAIEKVEAQEDGTLIVSGIASSETVDGAGETVMADAMRAAIPGYMKFGAVREMHQPIAAGTALSIDVDDAGVTHFEAHVVDAGTVQKVETGVLKGFSIGGNVEARDPQNKKTITALTLLEVSLVDVPCNPDAVIQIVKFQEEDMAVEPLAKWMGEEVWDAQTAIGALDSIMYLLGKESSEPDEPPIQVQALKDAAQRIKEFIASEIMEDNSKPDPMAMAAETGDLAKGGKKFSQESVDALNSLHKDAEDAMATAGNCMKALKGYWANGDNPGNDDAQGAGATSGDAAGKATEAEAITKADGLSDELLKVQTEKDALQKSLDAISADLKTTKDALEKAECTIKTKGALKAVPIEKGSESQPITPGVADAPKSNDPLVAMKAAQGQPITAIYNSGRA